MHTIETAVTIPLILLILLGGIMLSAGTLGLIGKQTKTYARDKAENASACVQVLRITEVVYEILEETQNR